VRLAMFFFEGGRFFFKFVAGMLFLVIHRPWLCVL
jgi:hypothetical protein